MTFYLKPPDGTVPVHLFQKHVECRLKFLIAISQTKYQSLDHAIRENSNLAHDMDCLIEGSAKDRASHFMLTSTTLLSSHMENVVIRGETILFQLRINNVSTKKLESSLEHLLRHFSPYIPFLTRLQFKSNLDFCETACKAVTSILQNKLLRCSDVGGTDSPGKSQQLIHLRTSSHGDSHVIKVPFSHVPSLVARREVSIAKGLAGLRCNQIKTYLVLIFAKLLEFSRDIMRKTEILARIQSDPRLQDISKRLNTILNLHGYSPSNVDRKLLAGLTLEKLQTEEFPYFPPCMANMYNKLITTHRLSHQTRVWLTLFLKDIGLPVDECTTLLQREYSKTCKEEQPFSHKCEHSWQKDSRRYIYGTRHLYGLEGSRKNYSSNSCESIQCNSQIGCTGCPFTANRNQFRQCLATAGIELDTLNNFDTNESQDLDLTPIEACHLVLQSKVQQMGTSREAVASNKACKGENILQFTKPTHYYFHLKKAHSN